MVRRRHGGHGHGGGHAAGGGGGGGASPAAEKILADAGFARARLLHVAVGLDLFSLLADGPATAEDVAVRLALDKAAAETFLNALCETGYLQRRGDRFSNATAAQSHLVKGAKGYLGDAVRAEGKEWERWGKLLEVVRSGRSGEGAPRPGKEEARAAHVRAEQLEVRPLLEKVKLEGAATLLAGGPGAAAFSVGLCRRSPRLAVTLLGSPEALEGVRELVERSDVHKRITLKEGDWSKDELGGPYDAVLLCDLLRQDTAEGAVALLRKVQTALAPGGRLVLKDLLLGPDRSGPGALPALGRLLAGEGRCYTAAEVARFLKEAGLSEVRISEPGALMEAKRPGPPREEAARKPEITRKPELPRKEEAARPPEKPEAPPAAQPEAAPPATPEEKPAASAEPQTAPAGAAEKS